MADLWLRWYIGTSEDAKLRVVSKRSAGTVSNAIALWTAILEDAAHLEHRGEAIRGGDFYAVVLEIEGQIVAKMLDEMVAQNMLSVSERSKSFVVVHWAERQFETDVRDPTAALRRQRFKGVPAKRARNGVGTVAERSKTPDTDSDTDTESKKETRASPRANGHASLDDQLTRDFETLFWAVCRNQVSKRHALKAYIPAIKRAVEEYGSVDAATDVVIPAWRAYNVPRPLDFKWCNPATWLNGDRWKDKPPPAPQSPPRIIGPARGL